MKKTKIFIYWFGPVAVGVFIGWVIIFLKSQGWFFKTAPPISPLGKAFIGKEKLASQKQASDKVVENIFRQHYYDTRVARLLLFDHAFSGRELKKIQISQVISKMINIGMIKAHKT